MIAESLLSVTGLTKSFGGLLANDAIDLDVSFGEILSVIGPNGAGKTTFLNQIGGEVRPDAGIIRFDGRDVTSLPTAERARLGIARSFQITSLMPSLTVLENVALGALAHAGRRPGMWRGALSDRSIVARAQTALDEVGLSPRAGVAAQALSHGERRQLEIAVALATSPRLLLLDEPTAGMGREESERMIELVMRLRSHYGILLVEHDMSVVFSVSDEITVLENGRKVATGTPDEIRRSTVVRQAYLGDSAEYF